MNATTKRAALYLRVSSHVQAEKGVSLEEQRTTLELWAKLEGWDVAGVYEEKGVTGGTDDRPELQRLIADAQTGLFDLVAVTKLDRFFRELRLQLNVLYELKSCGVAFAAKSEGIDTSKPGMSEMVLKIMGAVAEQERERIGERIRDTRAHRKAQGQWSSGRRPFGYGWDKKAKKLIENPLETAAVRFIFDTYVKQAIGITRVAEACNEAGLITPAPGRRKHTTWTDSTISHIIHHPAYKGGPNPDWPFETPAIISTDLWNAAQHRARENYHFRDNPSRSPFQGLIRCGLCHHTLRRAYSHGGHGGGTPVWECPGRLKRNHLDGSDRCTLKRFNAADLENQLGDEIAKIFGNAELFEKYIDLTVSALQKERQALERRLKPIQGNIEALKGRMERATVVYRNGQSTTEQYEAEIKGLKIRIAELDRQTSEADPMALKELKENEMAIAWWEGERNAISSVEMLNPNQILMPVPDVDAIEHPVVAGARQLRKLGLYAYVYPEKIEIKGSIGRTSLVAGCRTKISLPFKAEILCGGVAVG